LLHPSVLFCPALSSSSPLLLRRPLRPTLFPYTTLFRSSLPSCGCPSLSFPFPVSGPAFPEDVSLFFLWDFSSLLFSISVLICAASVTEANLNRSTIRLIRGASSSLRSEEHTSELQSRFDLVCRLLLEKKNAGS